MPMAKTASAPVQAMEGIVLGAVKHSDRAVVLTLYTPRHACVALVAPASSKRQATARMPLAMVEATCAAPRLGRELVHASRLTLARPYRSIYFHPVKNALGLFVAGLLQRLLRETPPDEAMYGYVRRSLLALDDLEGGLANFHLVFLAGLMSRLGVAPDLDSYREGALFDMRAGAYSLALPGHPDVLLGLEAATLRRVFSLDYDTMASLSLTRMERSQMLEAMLHYLSVHFGSVATLPALEILRQLFA